MLCAIPKKHLFVIVIFALALAGSFFNCINIIKPDNRYKMYEWQSSAIYWPIKSPSILADEYIEIFDIKEGRVKNILPLNDKVYNEVEKILNEVTGVYVKANPFPQNGYIVKVPLKPSVKIENKFFNYQLDLVYLLFPEKEAPFLMILDEEDRPYFYNFDGNADTLLKYLNSLK